MSQHTGASPNLRVFSRMGQKCGGFNRMIKKRAGLLLEGSPARRQSIDVMQLAFAGRFDCLEQGGGLIALVETLG